MSTILQVEDLNYKDILKGVSFNIKKNSFNVLIGPNSCGKTTLVKCLGGLLDYEGNIYFNKNIVTNKEKNFEIRKNIGIAVESIPVLDGTVLSNLMYPLLNLGYDESDAKKRIYSISDKLDIGFMLLKDIEILKNSEKKILNFLRAIIHDPKVIIIDDIFEILNEEYKDKIFNYLKGLNNKTILFVTTNEEYVLKANENNDQVIIMNKGKIVEQSSLEKIIEDEKKFTKNGLILPFMLELSQKLKAYNLVNDINLEMDKLVNEIWE